jgi:linoleoyl-CoA desaturase
MTKLNSINFPKSQNLKFYQTLNTRIESYFRERNLSKYASIGLIIKSAVLMTAYLGPLAILAVAQPSFAVSLLLWAIMGMGMAGVGMCVMHDANHGAFARNPIVNNIMSNTLLLLGGSVETWQIQHNFLHHTFTNVTHYDDDISSKPGLRLSPHAPLKKAHRSQFLHALFIYSLMTLYWVTAKDFLQVARYSRTGISKLNRTQTRLLFFKILLIKVFYFSIFIGIPLMAGIGLPQILAGFVLMHIVGGIILSVTFQLAHAVEETDYPLPDNTGVLEHDWAVHQLHTTVNFSPKNRFLTWYMGGLNFQVEHHLFPKISHVHYPKIARIVRETAGEFNIPYLEHRSFAYALRSHFSHLKTLGHVPAIDEIMG